MRYLYRYLSGTLTTIAPFFPLLFWPGIVGEFMKFLPLTLILTLFASLFVAYVINPVFAVTFMKRHEDDNHEDKQSFEEIKRPLMIMTVLAGIGYVIDRGIGNLFMLFIILYVFNHYVLTPKLIVPFQEQAVTRP